MSKNVNPYEVMGLPNTYINYEDLRKRYKFLSRKFHPDKHDQDSSVLYFYQLIRTSYENLKSLTQKITLPKMPNSKNSNIEDQKNDNTDVVLEQETPQKTKEEHKEHKEHKDSIVPGTNITENDIRILGEKLKDPWFHPSFNLTEFFGDVEIPKDEDKKPSVSSSMRPRSTRH